MGVGVSALPAYAVGDIVLVRRGKYAGKPFAVLGTAEGRVLIANGSDYTAAKPKKKNVIHLQQTHYKLEDVARYVSEGKSLDNGWLVQLIASGMANDRTR